VQLDAPVFVMKRVGFAEISDIRGSRGSVGIFPGLAALPLSSLYLKHAPIVTGFRFGYAHFLRKAHEHRHQNSPRNYFIEHEWISTPTTDHGL
jgi:hypothetical protein